MSRYSVSCIREHLASLLGALSLIYVITCMHIVFGGHANIDVHFNTVLYYTVLYCTCSCSCSCGERTPVDISAHFR